MTGLRRTAKEALRDTLQGQRVVGLKGSNWDNHAVALITLDGDLGRLSDRGGSQLNLDQSTRDTLLAHARQDAAHAVANTAAS